MNYWLHSSYQEPVQSSKAMTVAVVECGLFLWARAMPYGWSIGQV